MAVICPKCAYQRQPADPPPAGSCPRCGIIHNKYRGPQNPPPSQREESGDRRSPRAYDARDYQRPDSDNAIDPGPIRNFLEERLGTETGRTVMTLLIILFVVWTVMEATILKGHRIFSETIHFPHEHSVTFQVERPHVEHTLSVEDYDPFPLSFKIIDAGGVELGRQMDLIGSPEGTTRWFDFTPRQPGPHHVHIERGGLLSSTSNMFVYIKIEVHTDNRSLWRWIHAPIERVYLEINRFIHF